MGTAADGAGTTVNFEREELVREAEEAEDEETTQAAEQLVEDLAEVETDPEAEV